METFIDRMLARQPLNQTEMLLKVAAMYADAGYFQEALETLDSVLPTDSVCENDAP